MTNETPLKSQETAWLVIGDQVFNLSRKINLIGRSLDNDIVIQSPNVSRNHARILVDDGVFSIEDLNSTGGTFINKQKVTRSVLRVGDIITLANLPMVFVGSGHQIKVKAEDSTGKLDEG